MCENDRHTWALVPPIPKELTLALSIRSLGHGVASTGTCSFASLKGTGWHVLVTVMNRLDLRKNLLSDLAFQNGH